MEIIRDHENDEKKEKLIHVPWMNLSEWKQVYGDLYSKEVKLIRRGFDKLLLWKARQNEIPAGIESTLELIHVHLQYLKTKKLISEGKASIYLVRDLRVMSVTAIMRFLNHVSNITSTTKENLFNVAEMLNIPSWIVRLRHTGAHGSDLPQLSTLRVGIKFALDWLQENYWEKAAAVPGLVVSKSDSLLSSKLIGELLDVWQALKMYELNGYVVIDEIPDASLRTYVADLSLTVNKDIESGQKLSLLSAAVEVNLRQAIRQRISGDWSLLEKLIQLLWESESFIPPLHHMNITHEKAKKLSRNRILTWLCSFWKSILVHLQENYALFPYLVHKLLVMLQIEKSKHRQLVMALWIDQLCISMIKSQTFLERRKLKTSKSFTSKGIKATDRAILTFEKEYPHLKQGFLSIVNDETGNSCSVADVKLAVVSPNEFTHLFLPTLLDVAKPTIPDTTKLLLKELVSIYTKPTDVDVIDPNKKIHSIEDLHGSKKLECLDALSVVQSSWDYASEYEWATCPIGILPWQKDSPHDLKIPSHVTWKLTESVKESTDTFKFISGKKEADWPRVVETIRLNMKRKRHRLQKK